MRRLPLMRTPCGTCPKIPRSTLPADRVPRIGQQADLSPRNRRVIRHYRECRAVGKFPDDPLVRKNAAILFELEQQQQNRRESERSQAILSVVGTIASLRR